jgi:hypothetical protein
MVKTQPTLGSVSSGTMRPEDLIPTFLAELDALSNHNHNLIKEVGERFNKSVDWGAAGDDYWEGEEAGYDLEALFDALGDLAPDYCYFGSHEGDGADYGYWISWDAIDDAISEGSLVKSVDWDNDVPSGYVGHILEVNDHGNTTLYLRDIHEQDTEVWSCV